ncbi:hypothetical protein SUGI_1225400 [Cryptomeria japonica]|uniref:Uncharacterized protein n=1 Tax=Cryptomeria japonica TaxID=3369 RepID=A0AAD3RNT2_CRYJA|nr:hypothetical protein SUGI_1225400 [Cryptomeria japonica]
MVPQHCSYDPRWSTGRKEHWLPWPRRHDLIPPQHCSYDPKDSRESVVDSVARDSEAGQRRSAQKPIPAPDLSSASFMSNHSRSSAVDRVVSSVAEEASSSAVPYPAAVREVPDRDLAAAGVGGRIY